jgi:LmbE family N-acetylglucosaminyl deacetylase
MRVITCTVFAALVLVCAPITFGQGTARTLVAVWAHADDEAPVGPILARYAREGVQVYMIIATDGAQGAANTSVARGPEIATLRVKEARCSAQALGIQPPIAVERATKAMRDVWNGELPLSPMVPQASANDLFR